MLAAHVRWRGDGFTLDAALKQTERVTGVFGPSGAGKTTLMHAIAGLVRPDQGSIELGGRALFDSARRIDLPPHRRRIGVVFQDDRLFPNHSVEGNLRYGERHAEGAAALTSFDSVVALLELEPFLSRRIAALSGGERQRVALGRALLSSPRLLVMDEPLSSLDQRLKAQVLPFLRRVRDAVGIPMLLVSHSLSEILQLTDEVIVMDRGRVVGQGRYRELVHSPNVLDVIHERDVTNVVELRVARQEPEAGLTMLSAAPPAATPELIAAPYLAAAVGQELRVMIRPEDIALALQPLTGVSIQNQLRARVQRCTAHAARALVELRLELGPTLVAEVSLRTVGSLGLQADQAIWCLIKSNAVRYLDAAATSS